MKCMSCRNELTPQTTAIFNRILLCTQCRTLAEKSEREITGYIERAKAMALNWLTQHILQGGLLRGGSGIDAAETTGFPVRVQAQVQELRSDEGPEAPGVPLADREPASD